LLWCITTAGFDISGICYEVRTMTTKVLKGEVRDDTQFGIIYTIDEGDDWTSEEALMKANPNWGISVRPEMITSLLKKAKALPSAINNFKTKHLDIWCSASDAWMDMAAWHRCASEDLSLEDFEGRSCFIGLDLGAKNDITAKVRIFPRRDEVTGKTVYYVFGDYFLPQAAVENSTNSQYSGWQITEDIHVTEGAVTDFAVISEAIREDLSRFNVQSIAYDPWQATQLATELNEDGAPMVEYRNTVANLSDPMKWLEALIQDGRLVHNGDPVLTWMMGNVVAKRDNKDNIFPRKERYENKIDGVVALIFALGMCVNEEKSNSGFTDYESTEIPIFEW
jgi:phage terminase large subunit-like protein